MKESQNEINYARIAEAIRFIKDNISISSVESPFLRQFAEIDQGELIAKIQGHYWSLEIMREASDRFAWIF